MSEAQPSSRGPVDGLGRPRKRVGKTQSDTTVLQAQSNADAGDPEVVHAIAMQPPADDSLASQEGTEIIAQESEPHDRTGADDGKGGGGRWKRLWHRRWFKVSMAVLAILVIAGGAYAYEAWMKPKPAPVAVAATPRPTPTPSPTPAPVYDPLTGLATDAASAAKPVIGVMIENFYPYARPQSGLSQAGIVYEALAEGGITRFLALFQEPLPSVMGPVRSLRPYFLDWGLEHGVPVVHAGGSQPALAEIKPLGMEDINALYYDGSYFYRTTDRFAPHNLYTNASLLAQLDQKLGFATAPTFTPLPRKADSPAQNPPHPDIHINFSYGAYNVEYKYDPATDSYARFMGGQPHIDRNTNKQIYVKNVVVQFVNTSYGTQNDGEPMTIMQLVGSGTALVFEDGTVIQGTWSKASDKAQTAFTDASGKAILFNRGNTWISVVPTGNTVTY